MKLLACLSILFFCGCVTVPTCDELIKEFYTKHNGNVVEQLSIDETKGTAAIVFLSPTSATSIDAMCVELIPRTGPTTDHCIMPKDMDECKCTAEEGKTTVRCGYGTVVPEDKVEARK